MNNRMASRPRWSIVSTALMGLVIAGSAFAQADDPRIKLGDRIDDPNTPGGVTPIIELRADKADGSGVSTSVGTRRDAGCDDAGKSTVNVAPEPGDLRGDPRRVREDRSRARRRPRSRAGMAHGPELRPGLRRHGDRLRGPRDPRSRCPEGDALLRRGHASHARRTAVRGEAAGADPGCGPIGVGASERQGSGPVGMRPG